MSLSKNQLKNGIPVGSPMSQLKFGIPVRTPMSSNQVGGIPDGSLVVEVQERGLTELGSGILVGGGNLFN